MKTMAMAMMLSSLALVWNGAFAADSVGQGAPGRDSLTPSLPARDGVSKPAPRKDAVKPTPKGGVTRNARRDAVSKEPLHKDSVPRKKPGSS